MRHRGDPDAASGERERDQSATSAERGGAPGATSAERGGTPDATSAERGGAPVATSAEFGRQTGTDWVEDVLGPDYQQRTLALDDDGEGEVVATLVRHHPPERDGLRPARAVLYIHGWSDYFFQTHLAEYWTGLGAAFYALDLRKYGRSLREHQSPGYVADLAEYDEEIGAALEVIAAELGVAASVLLMGHSTGGLVAALWADRHPGRVSGLVLNSPWLELQGSSTARYLTMPAVDSLARLNPLLELPNIDPGYYLRSLRELDVDGDVNPLWRPTPAFPVRPGWLRAVTSGHAHVARGLSIDAPILVMAGARSAISARWSESMLSADIVLDVEAIVRRAVRLGRVVTVVRFDGGIHDLVLSPQPVRKHVFTEITRWCAVYGWG